VDAGSCELVSEFRLFAPLWSSVTTVKMCCY